MQQEKKCENCYYYKKYYTVINVRLLEVGGFCINDAVFPRQTQKRFKPELCQLWKPEKERIEKEKENIIGKINTMHKRLNDIALIIKNFENK